MGPPDVGLRHFAAVKSHASPVRPAVLAGLVPNDVGFVGEAPAFHNLKSFEQKGVWTPEIEVTLWH